MGSFSIWHWLIVLAIVVLVFGTKKLKNIGSDLGGAVKGFKDGVKDGFDLHRHSRSRSRPGRRPDGCRQDHHRRRSQAKELMAHTPSFHV